MLCKLYVLKMLILILGSLFNVLPLGEQKLLISCNLSTYSFTVSVLIPAEQSSFNIRSYRYSPK